MDNKKKKDSIHKDVLGNINDLFSTGGGDRMLALSTDAADLSRTQNRRLRDIDRESMTAGPTYLKWPTDARYVKGQTLEIALRRLTTGVFSVNAPQYIFNLVSLCPGSLAVDKFFPSRFGSSLDKSLWTVGSLFDISN